ncbi:MAG: MBL fold metallo-hydrolase [Candidatus Hodarchaeales archaeon]
MLESVTENLHIIRGQNRGRFPFSSSILITPSNSNSQAVLVDTGCGLEILNELRQKFNIVTIINSHTHPDHSAGNWLFEKDNCPIYVPREGFETAGNLFALSERFTEPGWLAKYWRGYIARDMGFREWRPTHSYTSESKFDFEEVILEPIYTPGHTVDHYCFYEPTNEILLSFDYDLTKFGPWYGHRESSISEFKQSIQKLIDLNPRMVISGHRGIIEGPREITDEFLVFLKKFDERDQVILALLENGNQTIEQLVEKAPIYGAFPYAEPLLKYWEGQMIQKHLMELQKEGKAINKGNTEWALA